MDVTIDALALWHLLKAARRLGSMQILKEEEYDAITSAELALTHSALINLPEVPS